MRTRKQLRSLSILLALLFLYASSMSQSEKKERAFYQVTIYHYNNADQEKSLDNYLESALLPALHRLGLANVGVFKSLANDTVASKLLYVFVPIKSLDNLIRLPAKLNEDKTYQSSGAAYINAAYTAPPYARMETILLHAFPLAPEMALPALKSEKKDRVYELRSYESATEKIFRNKVQMFNDGDEIGLFKKLNFNAVFYSEVIAGSKMPNLMYMTTFENMADRDAHWKEFGNDPYWKKLSSLPEYQNNVAHIDITFLRPVDYSDF
jgi:NIPSNAP protein